MHVGNEGVEGFQMVLGEHQTQNQTLHACHEGRREALVDLIATLHQTKFEAFKCTNRLEHCGQKFGIKKLPNPKLNDVIFRNKH